MALTASPPSAPLGGDASDAIRVCRVLCILWMAYVHVHPWDTEFDMAGEGVRAFDIARLYVVEAFSRSSVALLSIISGYLLMTSSAGRGFGGMAARKAGTLLVPLAAWNLIGLALFTAAAGGRPPIEASLDGLLDGLLALTGWPVLTPLAFLRDVLLCALLSPLLIRMVAAAPVPTLQAALAHYALVPEGVVFLRPVIPLFFCLGLAAAIHGLPRWPGPRVWTAVILAWAVVPVAIVLLRLQQYAGEAVETELHALRLVARCLGAAAVLWVAWAVLDGRFGRLLRRAEPYIFLFFCAHTLMFSVLWDLWRPVFGGYYGAAYPVFFALAPVVALALTVPAAHLGDRVAPWALRWLNGGRALRTGRRSAAPSKPAPQGVGGD